MVHSGLRWPEAPQTRQATGSRHSRTGWLGERQRKHRPTMERIGEREGVLGGLGGAAGVRRACR
jgi:hypothetical protein